MLTFELRPERLKKGAKQILGTFVLGGSSKWRGLETC